jgi:Mg2+ and Co2+ transporter CorA
MKVFTVLTVLFLPQTTVGGMWGMNMKVPMQATDDDPSLLPFFGITGLTIFFSILAFGYFRKRNYI